MHGQIRSKEPSCIPVPTVGKIKGVTTQKYLRNKSLSRKLSRGRRIICSYLWTLVNTLPKLSLKTWKLAINSDCWSRCLRFYDTHWIPVELTEEMLGSWMMSIVVFGAAMKEQQERACICYQRRIYGDANVKPFKTLQLSSFNYNAGANCLLLVAIVIMQKQKLIWSWPSLIFAETPFYAEMGGQVADHGQIWC